MRRLSLSIALCGLAAFSHAPVFAQSPSDILRLRIENAPDGRIEASIDGGRKYLIIGRVSGFATSTTIEKSTNEAGTVWKSAKDSLTLLLAAGRSLTIKPSSKTSVTPKGKLPAPPTSANTSTITTNIAAGSALFGELTPIVGSVVHFVNEQGKEEVFSDLFRPREGDLLAIQSRFVDDKGQPLPKESAEAKLQAISKGYMAQSLERAQALKKKIVKGSVNLRATLPENEPDPIAFVTFLVDGEEMTTQNREPFVYSWDTSASDDGEHLIEVRAYGSNVRLITKTRQLVYTKNFGAKE